MEFGEVEFFLVEEAEGDAFAFDSGDCGDADVDGLAFELEVDTSVLGNPAFRDVEAGHDF